MNVFWRERRAGQRLVLVKDEEGDEVEVGAVRQTRRGFDALAMTNTYDPGRAQKNFATMEEAKSFVESFHPWDVFGGDPELEVEPEIRPSLGNPSGSPAIEPSETAVSDESSALVEEPPSTETADTEPDRAESGEQSRGWRFWKRD